MLGYLWDRSTSLSDDEIFRLNPHLNFTKARSKSIISKLIDEVFSILIRPPIFRRAFESWVLTQADRRFVLGGDRLVHVDMTIHSYAEKQTAKRMHWKQGGHASQIIAKGFGVEHANPTCDLVFSKDEEDWIAQFLEAYKLNVPYVVIEPGTNRDWFGGLRGWPHDKWELLVQRFSNDYPNIPIIQIGMKNTPAIQSAIDLRGKTNFRQAALLMRQGTLFVGTEGGLMHAAKAVGANALILWGGVTLPEFAGYPDSQRIICHYVACAPCGNLGWCDKEHICMNEISVDEVMREIQQLICDGSC